jgi:hypothetical protein
VARIVKDPDWSDTRNRPSQYPYDKWLDGRVWEIEQGIDFNCEVKSIRSMLFNAAYRRDLVLRTKTIDNKLMFQAIKG